MNNFYNVNLPINYNSQYLKYANKTLDWLPYSDSNELFFENLKNRKQELIENGWLPFKNIKYTFNSLGFRCDEFDSISQSILFLGCSYTVGVGLNLEDTFSYITSKNLNLNLINLGIGGTGADTAFRLGSYWIPKIKPKIVIHLQLNAERIELISDNKFFNLLPNYCPKDFKFFYEFIWLSDDTNSYLNSLKNNLALEYICKQHNIKFIHHGIFNFLETRDLARDLMHPGVKSHLDLSKKLLNLI